jgi:hypothetical protein
MNKYEKTWDKLCVFVRLQTSKRVSATCLVGESKLFLYRRFGMLDKRN